jgi:taurine dioxygenase
MSKPAPRKTELIPIATRYQHIRPVPQQPNFAAHIEGVDLSRPLSPEVKQELYQALLDFEVIFLPPQPLTEAQHVDLASAFGQPAPGAFFPRKEGHPFVEVIVFDEKRHLGQPEQGLRGAVTRLPAVPAGPDGHTHLGDQRLARSRGQRR